MIGLFRKEPKDGEHQDDGKVKELKKRQEKVEKRVSLLERRVAIIERRPKSTSQGG